jgi:hypothetical protein
VLTPAPPLAVPAGPLAVRWLGYELPPLRAGALTAVRIELENAGTAGWSSGIHAAHHWLDPLGNPIVWGANGVPIELSPGARTVVSLPVRAPVPPGRYLLAFDLVNDGRYWFAEVGNTRLELDADVMPRIARRRLRVVVGDGPGLDLTRAALAAQEETIVDDDDADVVAYLRFGCRPAPDWSRRLLDAHTEGFAAVGGRIRLEGGWLRREVARELEPWTREFGRSPGWTLPLLCPSLVAEHADAPPWREPIAGLPTFDPGQLDEPTLCDGRIVVAADARALPPGGRRPA